MRNLYIYEGKGLERHTCYERRSGFKFLAIALFFFFLMGVNLLHLGRADATDMGLRFIAFVAVGFCGIAGAFFLLIGIGTLTENFGNHYNITGTGTIRVTKTSEGLKTKRVS